MYTLGDTSSTLLPIKFVLMFTQNLLVYAILMSKDDYIYGEVGQQWKAADKEFPEVVLKAGCFAVMGLIGFEFFMMILGSSVPFIYAKWNLIQIVLHFLGCLFSLWFILDTWQYIRIWYIFAPCSFIPFVLEIVMLQ